MKRHQFKIFMVMIAALLFGTYANAGFFGKSDEEKLRDAADSGDLELVKSLIAKGADVNWGDQYTGTALHRASYKGRIDMVKYLIEKGADVNAKIEPGLSSVFKKTKDEDKGILSEVENAHGATPLHLAVESNHSDIVKILIENGASLNITLTLGFDFSKRKNLRTALDISRSKGYLEISDYLEKHGGK